MIQLPNYLWFVQEQGGKYLTNVYSGSLGTDPQEGSMNKTTFNYKAFVKTTKAPSPFMWNIIGDSLGIRAVQHLKRYRWNLMHRQKALLKRKNGLLHSTSRSETHEKNNTFYGHIFFSNITLLVVWLVYDF